IPVAEPIDHEQMGADTPLAMRCRRAAREQVIRDRNHPSILLWAAMNEICLDRLEARSWKGYEEFARVMVAEIEQVDKTRPIIENDWVEPDPDRVFASPILTAHWYGRLHAEYLETIDKKAAQWKEAGKPLYVTEFGDWGLPAMPQLELPPFWDTREIYARGLSATLWPASVARFVTETQRYQGLSDRLQMEVFRRHDHLGGYCVTELTDVPHELNGLLDLDRNPKRLAVEEITRANQQVLPMLRLGSLVINAGAAITAGLEVANDGPELLDVTVECWFGDAEGPAEQGTVRIPVLPAYRANFWGEVTLNAPEVPGGHDLIVSLKVRGEELARNRYPTHMVTAPRAVGPVRVVGEGPFNSALEAVGAELSEDQGPFVVTERALDAASGQIVREKLAAGETVILLAQEAPAADNYPVPIVLKPLATAWGSSIFRFTNDEGWIPSLPRRNVLTAEDSSIHPGSVVVTIDGKPFPDRPAVIAYKPAPDALTGTLIGSTSVGPGRLIFCQYRVCEQAVSGDAAACAVLADVLRAPKRLARAAQKERITKEDGRALQLWWLPPGGRRVD
ncbi:MAG TPA: glycoside hydrolase family 2 TIM barrel-domain containing protein, partial [Actinomycetota bacterium]|nr:glycoside hydrolase family 2 TIM barrel-domain containing protein [Actinomycetota bacterium]